jgi:hypothetical protein
MQPLSDLSGYASNLYSWGSQKVAEGAQQVYDAMAVPEGPANLAETMGYGPGYTSHPLDRFVGDAGAQRYVGLMQDYTDADVAATAADHARRVAAWSGDYPAEAVSHAAMLGR